MSASSSELVRRRCGLLVKQIGATLRGRVHERNAVTGSWYAGSRSVPRKQVEEPMALRHSGKALSGIGGIGFMEIVCGTISESLNLRARLFVDFFLLLALVADPSVNLVCNFRDQQQVVPTERVGGLPFVAVFVKTGEGRVVTDTSLGVVFPDRGFDGTEPDLMCGLFFGLFGHGAFARCSNEVLHRTSRRIRDSQNLSFSRSTMSFTTKWGKPRTEQNLAFGPLGAERRLGPKGGSWNLC